MHSDVDRSRWNCARPHAGAAREPLDLLDDFPQVARATIGALTALQDVRFAARAEEEPGRILHEDRPDPVHRNPHGDYPYYGAVDDAPLYVVLIGAYVRRCGPDILDVRRLNPETCLDDLAADLSEIGYPEIG